MSDYTYKLKVIAECERHMKACMKKADELKGTAPDCTAIIHGEKYQSESEVTDAYGCGIITSSERDRALRKIRTADSKHEDDIKIQEDMAVLWKDLAEEIREGIAEEEKTKPAQAWEED